MAQTKKQRFREQKRAAKSLAPKPVVTNAPSKKVHQNTAEPMTGKKKLIIGAGVLVAAIGVTGAVFLSANPSQPEATGNKESPAPTAPPVVKQETNATFYRSMLMRDYKAKVDQELAEKVFKSCTSGESVTGPSRIRGEDTTITITCSDTKLKVINAQTKKEILVDQPPPPPTSPKP